MYNHLIYY